MSIKTVIRNRAEGAVLKEAGEMVYMEASEKIIRELEAARKRQPLDIHDFSEEELEQLKEVAPGEYQLLMEQIEEGK